MPTDLTTRAPDPLSADAPDLTRMMELAVTQGEAGVAALERLVALQERAQAIAAEREYADAHATFQAEAPIVARHKGIPDKYGRMKFHYAPLETIISEVGPLLTRLGFSYSFDTHAEQGGVTVTCTLAHRGGHTRTSSAYMPTPDIPRTSAAQKAGGAMTFAKRAAFLNATGILTADEDRGGEETRPEMVEPVTAEQAANLQALCEETGSDIARMCEWASCESLEAFPARRYREAVKMLEKKRESS